ncbi:MAG: tRNA (adenosine(37)-N6)-dimethylallyltransferase MiaA [Gaiellales bacterium]
MAPPVVALFGPTASGKSAIAVALAGLLGGEVVSADSMQVYRGLERITNQPTAAEQRGVPHHLVGTVAPDRAYDVVQYAADAHAAIDGILERGAVPIVAGGSGLYLRAALADMEFPAQVDEDVRVHIRDEVETLGSAAAHARLAEVDADAAARIDPADARRIVRALELHAAGASLAPDAEDALWTPAMRHPTRLFGLQVERQALRRRIDERTPRLLDDGGIDEIAALLERGVPLSHTAARAHGVDDLRELLEGAIDRAECERRLAARTRQYSKSQDTWLSRLDHAELVDANHPAEAVAGEIAERLRTQPR